MAKYILRRLLISIQLLLGASVVVFLLASMIPGDPVVNLFGRYDQVGLSSQDQAGILGQDQVRSSGQDQAGASGQDRKELQRQFGDKSPGPVRYIFWMKEILTGNLGVSIESYVPVSDIVVEAAKVTLTLVSFALMVAAAIGIAFGVISAKFRESSFVRSLGAIPVLLASIPPIFLVIWGIQTFAIRLGWLPGVGIGGLPGTGGSFGLATFRDTIIPTAALALPCIAMHMRHTRQSILAQRSGNPEQTEPAEDLRETPVGSGHVLRSAGLRLVRNLSLYLPPLIGGAIVVEMMHGLAGLGGLTLSSLVERDYPVQTAALLVAAVAVLAVRLLTDVAYGWLDPRVRGSSRSSTPATGEPATASHGAAGRQIGPPLELLDRPLAHRPWSIARRRFLSSRPAVAGLLMLLGFVAIAVLGPLAAPQSPYDAAPLRPMAEPSASHWLGTDRFGRDIFSLLLHGARTALSVGVVAVVISLVIGFAVGATAGLRGGLIDGVLKRVTDLGMTFPPLLLAVYLMVPIFMAFGPGSVALIIGIISWPGIARLVRRQVLIQRHSADAADSLATETDRPDIARLVLRNLAGPVAVAAAYGLAGALLTDATLSFLGLGSPAPAVSWGQMVTQMLGDSLFAVPGWVAPAVLIVLLVLSVHLIADGLRDAFDARSLEPHVVGGDQAPNHSQAA